MAYWSRADAEDIMLVKKAVEREWKPTDYPGIERSLFRNNDTGGRSSVVRLKKGSRFPRHAHHGTEEVVALSGSVTLGGVALDA
jgi:quercetin dioxygenase-like cupin family protein